MEHSGQLGSAMWMSLVPLTRAGTVGHGNKYLIAGFGEDVRGKVWRLFMQLPLQSFAEMEAENQAVARSIWTSVEGGGLVSSSCFSPPLFV